MDNLPELKALEAKVSELEELLAITRQVQRLTLESLTSTILGCEKMAAEHNELKARLEALEQRAPKGPAMPNISWP